MLNNIFVFFYVPRIFWDNSNSIFFSIMLLYPVLDQCVLIFFVVGKIFIVDPSSMLRLVNRKRTMYEHRRNWVVVMVVPL